METALPKVTAVFTPRTVFADTVSPHSHPSREDPLILQAVPINAAVCEYLAEVFTAPHTNTLQEVISVVLKMTSTLTT